jgi:hypothetical protein
MVQPNPYAEIEGYAPRPEELTSAHLRMAILRRGIRKFMWLHRMNQIQAAGVLGFGKTTFSRMVGGNSPDSASAELFWIRAAIYNQENNPRTGG